MIGMRSPDRIESAKGQSILNHPLTYDDFKWMPASSFASKAPDIPNTPGVYLLLIRNGEAIVDEVGYRSLGGAAVWSRAGWAHLYTGCSSTLRVRIKRHLHSDARQSTFRQTLLALNDYSDALNAIGVPFDLERPSEVVLTEWLKNHCLIGFAEVADETQAEGEFLRRTASPLNIVGRSRSPFASRLVAIRNHVALREAATAYDERYGLSDPHTDTEYTAN